MQNNKKKVKTLIVLFILATIALLVVSVALIVNINLAKKELNNQQSQIAQLEQLIENLKDSPSNNDQTIIPGGNQW